jgi:hypothetical protein
MSRLDQAACHGEAHLAQADESDFHDDVSLNLFEVVIARSPCDEAIHLAAKERMDCFAEFIIGRRFAPTRWLAMTV